ncbi:MAG: hypothetical protein ACREMO_08650 [Gemmatimonadales bacterium]
MDIPDRIIGDDVRLWRFRAEVLRVTEPGLYRYRNPVPVTAAGKLVGFAAIFGNVCGAFGGPLVKDFRADVAIDYHLPERLDVEAGRRLWTLPQVRIYPGCPPAAQGTESWEIGLHASDGGDDRTVEIVALQLRDDCSDDEQAAIGEALL